MNDSAYNCGDCVHAMDGADNVLRCRIHSSAMKCSPAAYQDCKRLSESRALIPWSRRLIACGSATV